MSDLATCFRFHRQNGMRAFLALEAARTDVEKHVDRYPSLGDIGAASEKGARFVERPAANGLRFVGYADKLARLNHTGWYTDRDGSSKIRGVVYQLPARGGRAVYVAGHDDENNGGADFGGPALLDFSNLFLGEVGGNEYPFEPEQAARDAAYSADSFAEREAEEEREYQAAWQAGNKFGDVRGEYRDARKAALISLKFAHLVNARESLLSDFLELRAEKLAEMEKLRNGDAEHFEFYPSKRLLEAFADGTH